MSLLQQIIDEATSSSTDVTRLLRLCLVLGCRLKNEQLSNWVRRELDGYGSEDELPDYRILPVINRGRFVGRGYQGLVLEVPSYVLPEEARAQFDQATMQDALSVYVDLVSKSDGKPLQTPWPISLAVRYASSIVVGGQCIAAWSEISPSNLTGMLDQIKTRILAFALALEEQAPEAGSAVGAPAPSAEQVTQIFVNNVYGSHIDVLQTGPEATAQLNRGALDNE
jgi:AbiTii